MLRGLCRIVGAQGRGRHYLASFSSMTVEIIQAKKLLNGTRRIQMIPKAAEDLISPGECSPISLSSDAPSGKSNAHRVLDQYRELKGQHPGKVILMQVGDFFEVFDEDAERVSRVLEIGLCNGRYKTPMTGFPLRTMDTYLERLMKAGIATVIVEQTEVVPSGGRHTIRRQVTRIITQGTVTEEGLLSSDSNNFILSIDTQDGGELFGLAWIDLSTGYFRVAEIPREDLPGELQRINPTELLVDLRARSDMIDRYFRTSRAVLADTNEVTLKGGTHKEAAALLDDFFGADTAELALLLPLELSAAAKLLSYVLSTQLGKHPYIEIPQRHTKARTMQLDGPALRSLELLRNNTSNTKENSLLAVLDETCTAAGSRLLAQQLSAPLMELAEINERLDQVEFFVKNTLIANDLRNIMRTCRDLERSFQRLALGRTSGGPRDMIVIKQTLQAVSHLERMLTDCPFSFPLNSCQTLVDELERAIVDAPPSRVSDGGVIKEGYAASLDELRRGSCNLEDKRDALVRRYRQETGKSSLKLSTRKTLGLLLEVNKSEGPINDNPKFILDSVVGEKFRYRTTELETLMAKFTTSGEDAVAEEIRLYEGLRQQIVAHGKAIMITARAIGELDVRTTAAVRAIKRAYVRPRLVLAGERVFDIRAGRHPVVEERQLDNSRSFVSNDCVLIGAQEEKESLRENPHLVDGPRLSSEEGHFVLLTGPNMGGKSTFLRQNAIIAIMAQAGMFVPASSATLSPVDAIHTRIGASDDLARDRSTFMVEMAETAKILRQATSRSLVIMDEIGRGTSAGEGFALAKGICKYLYERGCRTLFATHYTGLAALLPEMPGMQCLMTSAELIGGSLCFLHHIQTGIAEKSHALEVARLAGIPDEVISYSSHS